MTRDFPPVKDVVDWFRRNGFEAKRSSLGSLEEKSCCLIPALISLAGEEPSFGNPEAVYSQAFRIYGKKGSNVWRSFDNNLGYHKCDYGKRCREALEAAGLMVEAPRP